MSKKSYILANEKNTPHENFHTCSSSKTNPPSNCRPSSPVQKENPDSKSNCKTKIYCAKSEIYTCNEESVLAKGVWNMFKKTNSNFVEKPSFQLNTKTQAINSNVLSKRKISEDNGNKRPLKDITKQVLPSISQLDTPIQEIFKNLYISPSINASERENKHYLEPGSNICEIPDTVKIYKEWDEESDDKENDNAKSLVLSNFNFNVDSSDTKNADLIYPPSYYVDLLNDSEISVTLHDFHMLLNNYNTLWNRKNGY